MLVLCALCSSATRPTPTYLKRAGDLCSTATRPTPIDFRDVNAAAGALFDNIRSTPSAPSKDDKAGWATKAAIAGFKVGTSLVLVGTGLVLVGTSLVRQ